MKTEMKLSGLEGVLRTLQSLPAEIVSKRGGPVKSALRKGALVILDAEKQNLARVLAEQKDPDDKNSTGLLMQSLIVSRGKAPISGKGERYLVRVKRRAYQRAAGKEIVTTLKTAQLLEYGRNGGVQPAKQWIRPAFNASAAQAIATIQTELLKSIDQVTAKLARQNGNK